MGFLAELQPSPWDLKVGVTLDQRSLVFRSKLFTDLNRSRRIVISCLQLKISAQTSDRRTLSAPAAPVFLRPLLDPPLGCAPCAEA